MPRVMLTTLRPASGGFGEWDWVEAQEVKGAKDYLDYRRVCSENGTIPLRTYELDGRIRDQRGTVYKFNRSYMADGERVENWHYEMVWIEYEEGGN